MASRRIGSGLVGLSLMAMLCATGAMAREDGDDSVANLLTPTLPSAAARDVQTTGALPPVPPERMRQDLEPESATLKAAVAAYRRGALAEGDVLAQSIQHGPARAMLEWVALRSGANIIGFSRLKAFLDVYPDHPGTLAFRRQAEAALLSEKKSAATIAAFLGDQPPLTPAGRVALALAWKAQGETQASTTLIRTIWRQDHLGQPLEKLILAEFGAVLGETDHRLRAERYVFRGNTAAALRNAARVSNDYLALAKTRLTSAKAKRPIAPTLIATVPASQRGDISFAFLQAQQARRENKPAEAAKFLASVTRDPALLGDGDEWWVERRMIARKLLDSGDSGTAYQVAAGHGAEDAPERIEAEWHAGFIALRFRHDPALALAHFSEASKLAVTPISVARTAYWQGRAAQALGLSGEAQSHFARAAGHPVAYYGQLARAQLGWADLPLRQSPGAAVEDVPGASGVLMLYRMGARDLAATMLMDLAAKLKDTTSLETVAAIALREGEVRTLLAIGKTALQRGFPLDMAAFPTFGVPEFSVLGDPMERAIVHAIARQESAFDPTAISHAGARGLMQMMPATARETARRAKLPFDWPRLGRDPLYSAQMGAAHLNDLLKEWRGSYILTFAAYNAGSGNVKSWIETYGDPRKADVDAIDWVERIPFSETRNYVQRVMENLQVYRQRLNQRTAYLIDQDLKRGGLRE